jgi:TPR repeat protein
MKVCHLAQSNFHSALQGEESVSFITDLMQVESFLTEHPQLRHHEQAHIPERHAEADQIFWFARWVRINCADDAVMRCTQERLYRVAAAWGHDLACHELSTMLRDGLIDAPDAASQRVKLAEEMIRWGIPQGYYDMGTLLQEGCGMPADPKLATRCFYTAARLGNPPAQYYLGAKLARLPPDTHSVPHQLGRAWIRCAAEQGRFRAALDEAIYLRDSGNIAGALTYLQFAVAAGSSVAAHELHGVFLGESDQHYPGLTIDKERATRYQTIVKFLSEDSWLAPAILIDEITPLPPAPLPDWDGNIKWSVPFEEPLPLPSEARITQMAHEKGLDPLNGRPLTTAKR